MDRDRFDADPDPNFHVDADPDKDPTPSFTQNQIFLLLVTALPVFNVLSFSPVSNALQFSVFWTVY